ALAVERGLRLARHDLGLGEPEKREDVAQRRPGEVERVLRLGLRFGRVVVRDTRDRHVARLPAERRPRSAALTTASAPSSVPPSSVAPVASRATVTPALAARVTPLVTCPVARAIVARAVDCRRLPGG